MEPPLYKGANIHSNGQCFLTNMAAIDHMTNMAAMPIYRIETLQTSFSLEWLITLKSGMLIQPCLAVLAYLK